MRRPTLTPVSRIKKVFRPGERSLPRHEVIERLQRSGLVDGEAASRLVDEVLARPDSPVRTGHTGAILELKHRPHHLLDLAYRLLRDTHTPRRVGHILREVRRQTNLSWNQASRLLALELDPRFVQFEGDDRWYLTEWNLANDDLYRFARSRGTDRLAMRMLPHVIEQELGLSPKQTLLLPELDDRFRVDGETLHIALEGGGQSDQAKGEAALADNREARLTEKRDEMPPTGHADALPEVAAAWPVERHEQLTMEEEPVMNAIDAANAVEKRDVLHEVKELLVQAIGKLEARQQEMSREVVNHFQESNMRAIEALMEEKHRNEQVALGIRQVLAGFEQK